MAMNVTPFKSTDEFTMAGFNGKIDEINSGVNLYASEYWWRRRVPKTTGYIEKLTDITADVRLDVGTWLFYKTATISQTDGTISLSDQVTLSALNADTIVAQAPLYCTKSGTNVIYLVPNNATAYNNESGSYYDSSKTVVSYSYDDNYYVKLTATGSPRTQTVTTQYVSNQPGDWQYLHSPNRSAYPDSGIQDGYEYEYLGIPFDNAVTAPKIETGSYVGTGKYGENNPSQITFSFVPSWIIMLYVDGRYPHQLHLTDYGATSFLPMDALTTNYENTQSPSVQGYSADTTYAKKSADGKTFYWYNTNSAASQLNKVNDKIYYIAIG